MATLTREQKMSLKVGDTITLPNFDKRQPVVRLTLLNENTLQVEWKGKKGEQEMRFKVGDVITISMFDKRHPVVVKEFFPVQESGDILIIIEYLDRDKNELTMPRAYSKVLSVSNLSNLGMFVSMDSLKRSAVDEDGASDVPKKKRLDESETLGTSDDASASDSTTA
jgi:hypothetical protein